MKTSLTNPCLECDHHLAGGDKNCEKCKNCDKRLEYIDAIDKSPGSSVSEHVELEGHGGSDVQKSVKDNTVLDVITKTIMEDPAKIDPIEEHIKEICESAGMTIEKLRAGTKGRKDLDFHKIRDSIIWVLATGQFGKLSQIKIGQYLGVSGHSISRRMKILGIKPMRPKSKKAAKNKAPKPKPASTPSDKKIITLTLDDHPELYKDLLNLSRERLRTIENQALYILLQVHKRGMKLEQQS